MIDTILIVIVIFTIGVAIGAVLLRIGCRLCGVTQPTFGKAMGIVVITYIAQIGVQFALGVVEVRGGFTGGEFETSDLLALPIAMLVSAAVYQWLIPTTFLKGILIWLAQALIVFVAALAIVLVINFVTLLL